MQDLVNTLTNSLGRLFKANVLKNKSIVLNIRIIPRWFKVHISYYLWWDRDVCCIRSHPLESCPLYAAVWQRCILSSCHHLHLHPTFDNSTTQSDLHTPQFILTPQQLILPLGERRALVTSAAFSVLTLLPFYVAKREKDACSSWHAHTYTHIFPSFNQNNVCWCLKNCQATSHAISQPPRLCKKRHTLFFYQLSFTGATRELIALWRRLL